MATKTNESARTQLRGNCQCCGREQAVTRGRIAKHGYEVMGRGHGGYFFGVCPGNHFAPLQTERTEADRVIRNVRDEARSLREYAADLREGRVLPLMVRTDRYLHKERDYERVPYPQASERHQKDEIRHAISTSERRADAGESFANGHERLAARVHGTELALVKLADAPTPIRPGERRQTARGIVVARYMDGGMVAYSAPDEDDRYPRRMSTRSWRNFPLVEGDPQKGA